MLQLQGEARLTPKSSKIGLVLLNMGGPLDLDSVRPFLYNLFADDDIIQLPRPMKYFQKQFAWLIAKIRSKRTKEMYESIGGGSPIRRITESLATKISNNLREINIDNVTVVAMRYSEPRVDDAIKILIDSEIDTVLLFSQYPHYAASTTGSSFKEFYKYWDELKPDNRSIDIIELDNWGEEREYITWWENKIKEKIGDEGILVDDSVHIIFSAHGLPQSYINKGEKYQDRLELAYEKIVGLLQKDKINATYHLSFQSRAGPFPWIQPYTDDVLRAIAPLNPTNVLIVPLGFVSNHVETLYEIDILYRDLAEELGISSYHMVEVPDDSDIWAEECTTLLVRALKGEY